jgi:hypothetical protein
MEPVPMVRLRTGGEPVPLTVVKAVVESLDELLSSDWLLFMELVHHARDPRHELSADQRGKLADTQLLKSDGRFVTVTHQIIVAAVEGEGLAMRLVDPRHPDDKELD